MKLDAIQYIPHEQPMVFIDHLTDVAEGRAQGLEGHGEAVAAHALPGRRSIFDRRRGAVCLHARGP